MTKYSKLILVVTVVLLSSQVYAQLRVDAEVRPRFEYRHGFADLFPDDAEPAAFVSQRTRLKAGYSLDRLKFYLNIQDVRVWGDVPQLNRSDRNGLSVHEAWADIKLDSTFSLKLGRQEIIYDDSRIFGNVEWAQQARSHDVAMLKFKKGSTQFDLGAAFNQDGEAITGNVLTTNTYKSFQYLWLHNDWQDFSGSFLFLNNGRQYVNPENEDDTDTRYSQTVGTHLKLKKGKWNLASNLFYQFGNDVMDNDLSAYLLGLDVKYAINSKIKIGAGGELQSGNDNGAPSNGDNNAFTPFYGTNHKFNGLMDYFYVGNHINNVGLLDLYINAGFTFNAKSNINVAVHNFSAPSDLVGSDETQLGNEVDIVYSYKLQKNIAIKAGYSHLFASEGMEVLKNNFDGNTNNWGWVMVVVNPTLFESKKD